MSEATSNLISNGVTRDGGLSGSSMRYPSPFFDIGHTYLPTSIKHMFRWCRYYFLTNPLINAVTYKMSEYPVTPIIIDEESSDIRDKWQEIIEHQLKLRTFEIETGLDYHCYGIAAISIHFPFEKFLVCPSCKTTKKISECQYKFRNLKYLLACEKCLATVEAQVKDVNIKNLKGIRLIRWNPEYLVAEHNDLTGETAYFFEMPTPIRNDIMMGKRHIVETVPDVYIRALREQKQLRFTSDNLFILRRPTIAQKDMGWGMPLILPVLKDTYYLQILRKGQEAIANQHIIPLRLLFPQPGSADSNPYSTTDLGMWRKRIEGEIQKWRRDPNYIPILPLPVGNQTVGGEGKALMLHQEMRAWSEQIVAGMQVPVEFIFGGLSYSGSNVSMRMLENQFLGFRENLLVLCRDFILGRIADYMDWPRPRIRFARFKMADDLQRLQLMFQMNQAMKLSDKTLLDEADMDLIQEEKHKSAEFHKQIENQRRMQLAQASLQGEVMLVQSRYQAQSQKLMQAAGMPPEMAGGAGGPPGMPGAQGGTQQPLQGEQAAPGMPEGSTVYPENAQQAPAEGIPLEMQSPLAMGQQQGGLNVMALARRAVSQLNKLDEMSKQIELMKMKGSNPQLYTLVLQILFSEQGSQADALDPTQSPLAQQKPPRSPTPLV